MPSLFITLRLFTSLFLVWLIFRIAVFPKTFIVFRTFVSNLIFRFFFFYWASTKSVHRSHLGLNDILRDLNANRKIAFEIDIDKYVRIEIIILLCLEFNFEFVLNIYARTQCTCEMHCAIYPNIQNAKGTEKAIKMKLALCADHCINWQL